MRLSPVANHLKWISAALAALLLLPATDAAVLTVNTASGEDVADGALSLTEALKYLNGRTDTENYTLQRSLTPAELAQISGAGFATNQVRFAIPGAGPHFISTPAGGFPKLFMGNLLIDGYSQPGAQANTHPITQANNAALRVVLDARLMSGWNEEGDDPSYTLMLHATNVTLRGCSVLSSLRIDNFGIRFVAGSRGGQVSGCWLGVSPDQTIVAGGQAGVSAYQSGGGHIIGTDGDGVGDRGEFNVIAGQSVNLLLQLTRDLRVSGNFIGVLPDGLRVASPDPEIETEGDGVQAAGVRGRLLLGTDGDGIADADEPNLFGGLPGDVFQCYTLGSPEIMERVVFQGNRLGLGVDGTTPLPLGNFLTTTAGAFEIGAAPDGPVTAAHANLIAHVAGHLVNASRTNGWLSLRGNELRHNATAAFQGASNSLFAQLLSLPNASLAAITPTLVAAAPTNFLAGTLPLPTAGVPLAVPALVDVYLAEPASAPTAPQGMTHLATFTEGSAADLDLAPGRFRFSLAGLPVPAGAPVVISTTVRSGTAFDTSPFSNAVIPIPAAGAPPVLTVQLEGGELVLAWVGTGFKLQGNPALRPVGWQDAGAVSPVRVSLADQAGPAFYRLVAQ